MSTPPFSEGPGVGSGEWYSRGSPGNVDELEIPGGVSDGNLHTHVYMYMHACVHA